MRKNGCFDRAPLRPRVEVQDGWEDGMRRMVIIPDPMTKSCQYAKDDQYGDKGCIGCKHKEAK